MGRKDTVAPVFFVLGGAAIAPPLAPRIDATAIISDH